jgi:hypothetical protein
VAGSSTGSGVRQRAVVLTLPSNIEDIEVVVDGNTEFVSVEPRRYRNA